MGYTDKTVKELRAIAEERGIKVPKSAKKGDLVTALLESDEPIDVKAEVIENKLAVSGSTLSIDSDELVSKVTEITDAIDELAKVTEEMDATPETIAAMSLEDVTICRKGLSKAMKAADEKRLEFGRILRAPIDLVNARCKELTKEAEQLNGLYKAREKQAEEDRRIDKKNELREHYEAYAGVLPDMVPYEKLHEEQWLNKGFNVQDAKAELEAKVDKLGADWKSLRAMNLEFVGEAEARLFDSLDLGEAISWAQKLADDKRKIEAMKAEIGISEPEPAEDDDSMPLEAYEGMYSPDEDGTPYEPDMVCGGIGYGGPVQPPAPQQAPVQPTPMQAQPISADSIATGSVQAPGGEKGAVIAEISDLLKWYDLQKLRNLREALQISRGPQGPATERVMVVNAASDEQLHVIGKFCGLVGVTGTFKNGTLAEVVQRENWKAAQGAGVPYGA